jgi:adenylate kinase
MIATTPVALPDPTAAALPERREPRRYRTILLFGAPGSGKGTMGKALGVIPGFAHVACGDVFRSLDLASPLGKVFLDYSSRGLLVPDDTSIALWEEFIDTLVTTHTFVPERDILVLDGIPRNVPQARLLEPYIDVERVFHLVCADETMMMARLRRRALKDNRLDDASNEVIRRRLEVYQAESRPVLEFYPADHIVEVDALATPVQVLHTILGHLLTA